MATKKEQVIKIVKTNSKINEGLKDQISYMEEIGKLAGEANRMSERQFKTAKDILDKTKDIYTNRKNLTEEQLTSVDLHKLERKMIAEGLEDHIQIVQKLKQEYNIQKQINRTVNTQAKLYNNIGSSIDSFIRKIPGGGFLGDLLGTGNLGKEMSESFRTEMSKGGLGEFGKNVFGEAGGGFMTQLFLRGKNSKAKKAARMFFTSALLPTLAFGVTAKLFATGISQGFQSQGLKQAVNRFFFGGAFEGIRSALGTGAKAEAGTLRRLVMNKFRFGVSEADQAKILSAQVNIAGLSQKSALNIQQSLASSAAMRGVLPQDIFSDIANNTEQFATYAKDGGLNIGEAAIRARELGVSLDTVFKVSDGILDFQSSIENELKASLLIGRQLNLNEARRLAMAGDMAGLQEEILRQVGSEEELQRMNAIQRKSLAGALGVTVSELNKLASGELEVKNSDMKQNTSMMQALNITMMALTAAIGATLLARGLQYGSRLIGFGGGFSGGTPKGQLSYALKNGMPKSVLDQFPGTKTLKGLPNMTDASNKAFMASIARGNPQMMGTQVASVAARTPGIGQIAAVLIAISGLGVMIKKLVGSSEQTAKNTKSSITNQNFITSVPTRVSG